MQYFKLQLGCLAIVLYITFLYVRATAKKIPCNPRFDLLLYLGPWAIAIDGATAWMVNCLDSVPYAVNMIAHALFFLLVDAFIIATFLYMDEWLNGQPRTRKIRFLMSIPGLISMICIVVFMPQLRFETGMATNYSMGISPVICYVSVIAHFLVILVQMIVKRKSLERQKWFRILSFILIIMAILLVQVIYKEALVSALFPTFMIIGLYINVEDPFLRKVIHYNEVVVTDFATLVENRDDSTGGHIKRTKEYVHLILHEMRKKPKYRYVVSRDYYNCVINAAPLHDIGKISTPDAILQKPGKLTAEEYDIMKQHAARGGEIIKQTFASLEEPEFEHIAYEVAHYHHEKWNGKGYPEGISGNDIPLHARIMAIADVFDAISAKRCYRDAMPLDKCFQIIEEGRGTDFDPELTDIFLQARPKVEKIYYAEQQ